MNKAALIAISFLGLMGVGGFTLAADVHHAHTHGVANLTLAFESGVMEVQFESPAMSLLGFEHTPKTQQQIEIVKNTKAFLNTPANVLSTQGADCSSSGATVSVLGPAGEPSVNSYQHHNHHALDEQHSGHETNREGHSEVSANYQFNCADGQALRSISILIFKHFPGLEKIEVNWVTETQQGQSVLSPKYSTVELR